MEPISKPNIDKNCACSPADIKCMLRSGKLSAYDAMQLIANMVDRISSENKEENDIVRQEMEELKRLMESLVDEITDISHINPLNRKWWLEKPIFPYRMDDIVFHLGCAWICNKDDTKEEPTWMSNDWVYLMGDCRLSIDMRSTGGVIFRKGDIQTTLVCNVMFGTFDVTRKVLSGGAVGIEWSRDTVNEAIDQAWVPYQNIPDDQTSINLRVTNYDVGFDFWDRRMTKFTLSMQIPTSDGYKNITREINIKI